ncbi:hypothetical protein BDN71DRAFT_1440778 [Pleurotus eryngii]|uniref:MARVEL domain-containing protein n=1 Tax=Pleurotus eryngii TaxID=5323 RepID=A0A9P6DCY7_PLEER|nr:hypothetical protein BDN71DRAFT_1440778 [Pleurotus eryngii]
MAISLGRIVFILRYMIFAILIVTSLIAFAVSAHFLNLTRSNFGGLLYFSPLVIAVGAFSFVSLIACFLLDLITRSKIFTSKIAFEIGFMGFLFCAWMGAAGYSAWSNEQTFGKIDGCNFRRDVLRSMCSELPVVVAFSFISAFVCLFYCALLILFGVIRRQHNIFGKSVREASLIDTTPASVAYAAKQDYYNGAQPVAYGQQSPVMQGYYTHAIPPMQYPGGIQAASGPYQTSTPSSGPMSMYPQPQGPQQPPPAVAYPAQAQQPYYPSQ